MPGRMSTQTLYSILEPSRKSLLISELLLHPPLKFTRFSSPPRSLYTRYTGLSSHLVSYRRKMSPAEVKVALAPVMLALLSACAAGATSAAPPKGAALDALVKPLRKTQNSP